MGTPNREPQEYSRNVVDCKDLGRYIPITFLLHSWGYLFGVPSKVPLNRVDLAKESYKKLRLVWNSSVVSWSKL